MEHGDVRRGGRLTPGGFLFELTGGDVSLDFVNTVDMRPLESRKELLPNYAAVCAWARQSRLITPHQESELRRRSALRRWEAERARRRIVAARECLFLVFTAVIGGGVPRETLRRWNGLARRAMAHMRMEPRGKGLVWSGPASSRSLDFMLWPVIHSAVTLLTGEKTGRIRRCASEGCDWMFLDSSKRGNRRWCDMTVCGNRAKAKRFYWRKKHAAG